MVGKVEIEDGKAFLSIAHPKPKITLTERERMYKSGKKARIYVIDSGDVMFLSDASYRSNDYIRTYWRSYKFILKEDRDRFIQDYGRDYDIELRLSYSDSEIELTMPFNTTERDKKIMEAYQELLKKPADETE